MIAKIENFLINLFITNNSNIFGYVKFIYKMKKQKKKKSWYFAKC